MIDFAAARIKMVDSQLRTEDVTDADVLSAMGEVPREAFVPARLKPLAYVDDDLVVKEAASGSPARYLVRPAPFARLVQAATIRTSDIVLDVGTGTGYSAAVLAKLAGSVVALESDPTLAGEAGRRLVDLGIDNVAVVRGALADGYPSEGPYDAIVVSGGAIEIPPDALLAQLKDGGRLVAIVGSGRSAPAMLYTRTGADVGGRPAFDAYLPQLPGFARPKAFAF
jgi:protein-L-isoaspartate(D-aspartate) O-methyltransferase